MVALALEGVVFVGDVASVVADEGEADDDHSREMDRRW